MCQKYASQFIIIIKYIRYEVIQNNFHSQMYYAAMYVWWPKQVSVANNLSSVANKCPPGSFQHLQLQCNEINYMNTLDKFQFSCNSYVMILLVLHLIPIQQLLPPNYNLYPLIPSCYTCLCLILYIFFIFYFIVQSIFIYLVFKFLLHRITF